MSRDYFPLKLDLYHGEKNVLRIQLDVNKNGFVEDVQFGNQLCPIDIQQRLNDYFEHHLDQEWLKDLAQEYFAQFDANNDQHDVDNFKTQKLVGKIG